MPIVTARYAALFHFSPMTDAGCTIVAPEAEARRGLAAYAAMAAALTSREPNDRLED